MDVSGGTAGEQFTEAYRENLLTGLTSAVPFTKALADLDARHEDIRQHLAAAQAEPTSAARRLRKP
jgi:hypothetical protein